MEDPAFKLSYDTHAKGRVVTVTETLEMRADHVPAAEIAGYADKVRAARDALGVNLFLPDAAPAAAGAGLNWPVAMLSCVMLAGALWLARRAWRHDPAPRGPRSPDDPQGFGGWLILPMIGVVVGPLRVLHDVWGTLPAFSADTWTRLTVPGSESYNPSWAPFLLTELGCNIVMTVFWMLLPVLFFRRRSSLPRLYIAVLGASLLVRLLDGLAATAMSPEAPVDAKDWATFIRDVLSYGLWSWYFLVSRRVAATFVNRLHPVPVAAVPAPGPAAPSTPPAEPLGEPSVSQA